MNLQSDEFKQGIIFRCVSGSYAYGTQIEGQSDRDERGVFIAPPSRILSCTQSIGQIEDETEDTTIYELQKFMKLAANNNPNLIELLYTEDESTLFIHPAWSMIRANRHLFLSKKARHTFSGYAMAQLHRIKGHHKWITNPQPEQHPRLGDYCKVVLSDGSVTSDPETIRKLSAECFLVETFGRSQFRIFKSPEFFADKLGFFANDELQVCPINVHDDVLKDRAEYVGFLIVNFDEFKKDHKNWKDYWSWKNNRNEARAKLEEQYGFDCYSADTEFLTESGWKLFDDIHTHDRLATLNQSNHQIEYQEYIERHESRYTGTMHMVKGHHTDIRVSGNHRMFIKPFSRKLGKSFSKIHKTSDWTFLPACKLPDCFEIVNRINPKPREFKNDIPCGLPLKLYLRLMGWYVSEGSIAHRLKDGTASVLSLSQLKGGRLQWHVSRAKPEFAKFGLTIREYSHYRESKDRTEMTWTLLSHELVSRLEAECGSSSETKRLPRWVMSLSARMQRILLNALHIGDGTDRNSRSEQSASKYDDRRIYYTSSPCLANDVNELAFLAGMETSKWGPYENDGAGMFQVHISSSADGLRRLVRNQNVTTEHVTDERIVCFTVPNEVLITRRNGNIAIQGNTKHAMHLVRLMRMCQEILREGKVIVRRPDAEELLRIRNGDFDYQWLLKWAEDTDASLEELYQSSPLPFSADYAAIDELYRETTLAFWRSHNLIH